MSNHTTNRSFFMTTARNRTLYWSCNLVTTPAYMLCLHLIISSRLGASLWSVAIQTGLSVLILITLSANVPWQLGYKNRLKAYIVGLLVIASFVSIYSQQVIYPLLVSFSVVLVWGIVNWFYASRYKFLSVVAKLLLIFLSGASILLGILYFFIFPYLPAGWIAFFVSPYIHFCFLVYLITFSYLLSVVSISHQVRRKVKLNENTRALLATQPTISRTYVDRYFIIIVFSLIISWLAMRQMDILYSAILALLYLLVTSNLSLYFSRQRASLSRFLSPLRHDNLNSQVSPTLSPANPINQLFYWLRKQTRTNGQWVWLGLLMTLGAIIIPGLEMWLSLYKHRNDLLGGSEKIASIMDLIQIGIISSLLLAIIFLLIWFVKNRQKHIVVPFKSNSISDKDVSDLNLVAGIATHTFVEQLRHIALLLNLRQVENVNDYGNSLQALFVTSGQEHGLNEQIQSLANLEAATNSKLHITDLFTLLMMNLAHTKVHGTIQKHQSNSFEVWIELTRRDGHTVAVDKMIIPGESAQSINERTLQTISKDSAIKLMTKLGQGSHLATSWQSLKYFLQGLEASSHHDWWRAIASYQRAIQLEETTGNEFGIGHYHLGAALIFQGNMEDGLKHLQISDAVGPPLAETQYTLALALLYKHWSELHTNRQIFKGIIKRGRDAITLRSHFPEAWHLLGVAYYQRGQLHEQTVTRDIKPEQKRTLSKLDYKHNYRQAAKYLKCAIRQYQQTHRRLAEKRSMGQDIQIAQKHVIRNNILVTRLLADAQCALRLHSAADILYQDVSAITPSNIQNLVDRLKNYCMAGNWQYADEFLHRHMLNSNNAMSIWQADANLYIGWAKCGALVNEKNKSFIVQGFLGHLVTSRREETPLTDKDILFDAFMNLDYALHQKPDYILSWSQSNWQKAFAKACHLLDPKAINPTILNWQRWLGWRIYSYGGMETLLYKEQRRFIEELLEFQPNSELKVYIDGVKALHKMRQRIRQLLETLDKNKRVSGLYNTWQRLQLAKLLFDLWQKIDVPFTSLSRNEAESTGLSFFEQSLALDIYLETALLTIRMLAEGRAYETARYVACKTNETLTQWLQNEPLPYHNIYTQAQNKNKVGFSPKVLAYQRATLTAWEAYASLCCRRDFATQARTYETFVNDLSSTADFLDRIQEKMDSARKLHPQHPLVNFVQAQIFQERDLHTKAIDVLLNLLTLVAPFNPKTHFAMRQMPQQVDSFSPGIPKQAEVSHASLTYMERVSGQRQFEDILDRGRLHTELADLFQKTEQPELSIEHLLLAIAWSPYRDLDVENFLRLAQQLKDMYRFTDALDAIQEVKAGYNEISLLSFSTAKRTQSVIEECINKTRLACYHESLQKSESIYRHVFKKAEQQFTMLMSDNAYDSSLENIMGDIEEFRGIFRGILTETKNCIQEDAKYWQRFESQYKERESYEEGYDESNYEVGEVEADHHAYLQDVAPLVKLIAYRLHPEYMHALLKDCDSVTVSWTEFNSEKVIRSQIIVFLAREALHLIEQRLELVNNIAYNRAELNIELGDAKEDIIQVIKTVYGLFNGIVPNNLSHVQAYNEHMARYYDTLGYIHMRNGGYDKAIKKFRKALEFFQGIPMLHYHLARAYLMQLEILWQELTSEQKKNIPVKKAIQISLHLRECIRYWQNAYRLDNDKRLHGRLMRLRARVDTYQTLWDKALMWQQVGGNKEATPLK